MTTLYITDACLALSREVSIKEELPVLELKGWKRLVVVARIIVGTIRTTWSTAIPVKGEYVPVTSFVAQSTIAVTINLVVAVVFGTYYISGIIIILELCNTLPSLYSAYKYVANERNMWAASVAA